MNEVDVTVSPKGFDCLAIDGEVPLPETMTMGQAKELSEAIIEAIEMAVSDVTNAPQRPA